MQVQEQTAKSEIKITADLCADNFIRPAPCFPTRVECLEINYLDKKSPLESGLNWVDSDCAIQLSAGGPLEGSYRAASLAAVENIVGCKTFCKISYVNNCYCV